MFAQDLGLLPGRRRLCIDDCAKCVGARIGEAKNPGPRRRQRLAPTRLQNLDDVDLLEPQTVAMRQRFWSSFTGWIEQEVGSETLANVLSSPLLLVKSLEAYGKVEFAAGTPLFYYRQLIAHVQREFPLARPFMNLAWRMVSKWEMLEPVQHRLPLPEPLMLAMCSLGLLWEWPLLVPLFLHVSMAFAELVKS